MRLEEITAGLIQLLNKNNYNPVTIQFYLLRLSRNDHSQIRLIVTDLLFIMSPVRKEKTSESFVILRIILSEAGHQTVISLTDYELVEIRNQDKSETLFCCE